MVPGHVARAERPIRLGHAHQLHLRVRGKRVKPAQHMPVHQADDGHANGRRRLRANGRRGEREKKQREQDWAQGGTKREADGHKRPS